VIVRLHLAVLIGWALCGAACGEPNKTVPLVLDGTIALPETSGRIDHLSIDLKRKRLFVAELGNDTVDVVDLASSKVVHRIAGLDEPQGVVYVLGSDRLVVACGGDGTVRIYGGEDYAAKGTIKLDDDADNVRLDAGSGSVVVGHGSGGLAIIDPLALATIADIRLPAHPEAFVVAGGVAYVNIPDARQVAVVDLKLSKIVGSWTPPKLSSNFPMALGDGGQVAIVFRGQDRLVLLDPKSGTISAALDTCGDADDVFFDAPRKRFYVSCGAGYADVISQSKDGLHPAGRASTSWGARTSLFVPELDRLFVAERAGLVGSHAGVAVYRPLSMGE